MSFFNSTSAWIKGEIFEGVLILVFGASIIFLGLMFWKFGGTPNARALIFPLIIVGFVYSALGGSMYVSNQTRLPVFQQKFSQNQSEFIQSEKKRVEAFQYMYTISKVVATVCFSLTLLIFWLSKSALWQGWSIGLALFAISGLVVDYFSKERAEIYYKVILEVLK
ncbi:hypothetical protein [Mucilaginibacter sp.]|uniref:hypothetical protein n=1 Tax=Mucilaginibacter sp. TaxID=1882438 RepID=UPI002ED24E19